MTETTAKKGMTRYKKGHGKNDFDFDYLRSLNYDDKRTLKQVIETLFNDNVKLREKMESRDNEIVEMFEKKIAALEERLAKYDRTFEQSIKDFLTKGF